MKYICLFLIINYAGAQQMYNINGAFPQAPSKEILLNGFTFEGDSLIAKTLADNNGNFALSYPASYKGAAILKIKDSKSLIVLLNCEDLKLQWDNINDYHSLKYTNSPENDAFANGIELYQNTEGKRNGLSYLLPYYRSEPIKQDGIKAEIAELENAMSGFLSALPSDSYAGYYLSLRKLISDMPQTTSRYFERIPQHEEQFNNLNFTDQRLLHSGLIHELLDAYFLMLESYGEQSYVHINQSTDYLLQSLKERNGLKQDIAEYLFKLYEKRSLFPAAEHLAQSMFSEAGCKLDGKREALFEQYRKMSKGSKAPDIRLVNSNRKAVKLTDLKSRYKLVVFGASWCNKCAEDVPKLKFFYQSWKNKSNMEIVFISLDNDKSKYDTFIKGFPWISSCDFKGWESKAARDYFVMSSPTMYLLDSNNIIMLKPISPEQVSAWLEINK